MLAQEQISFAPAIAALTAALVVAGPVAVAVTKVVDFVRNLFGDREPSVPGWVWIALAWVVAFAMCFGWNINLANVIVQAVPALANSDVLAGSAGTAVTAAGVAGMASFWHDKMAQWAAAHQGTVIVEETLEAEPMPPTTTTRRP
jgi:hypothetical protein